jgi:hypothetical protein
MRGVEFLARLAALICPPRCPLVRFAGVLAPRSAWRRQVVPKPRERIGACAAERAEKAPPAAGKPDTPEVNANGRARDDRRAFTSPPPLLKAEGVEDMPPAMPANDIETSAASLRAPRPGDVVQLAPDIIAVKHWERLLGGLLYAVRPRVDWATLLRRSLSVDVLECPKCHGRLRVLAVITEPASVQRILARLGLPTRAPPIARARDPTDDLLDDEPPGQLALGLV